MELFFSLLFWVLVFLLALLFFSKRASRILEAERQIAEEEKLAHIPIDYTVRRSVMNSSEASFYFILERELGDDFHIFPKVRVADILRTVNGKGYYLRRNKILSRHVDFLISDKNFKPLLAIELDGPSHRNIKKQHSDQLKNEAFKKAHFPLRRVMVGSDFSREIDEIKIQLN